jgi:iron complex transport system ATP-binding protein
MHGSVLLCDKDIWTLRTNDVSQRLAIMPQAEHRDWSLTVEDAVRFGRVPHRGWLLPYRPLDQQIVEQALANMSLYALRNRPITELSGGEWRRVILARALAQEAKVLLLDEPIAGLDLKFQVEVLRLVRRLATEQQLVVVLTLHDLNQASFYGHRLALLSESSLKALGSPQEVLTEELISQTFGVPVAVTRHPVYGTPLVAPLGDFLDNDESPGSQRVS